MTVGGTSVSLGDDQVSGALPIGFSFDFFCQSYSNFYISSNGFITFSAGQPTGCCSGQFLPNGATPNNLVAGYWEDLDPGNGGAPAENAIGYQTIGTAPNRILKVKFFNVDHFSNGTNVTFEIRLYEANDRIEVHCTSCPSDGGIHTQGIENSNGTLGYTIAGRNAANFSLTNNGAFFAPQSNCNLLPGTIGSNQTICSGGNLGSFTNVASPSGGATPYTYQWQQSVGCTGTYSNISGATGITYNPPTLTSTTCYRRVVTDACNDTGVSNAITITVVADPTISASASATICSGGSRTLTSSTSGGTGTCTYQWQISSTGSTSGFSNISGATGSSYNTGSLTATRWYRVVRNCNGVGCNDPISNAVQITVVPDPTITASGAGTICIGGNRTLTSSTSGGTGTCTYQWQISSTGSTSGFSNISGATGSSYNTGALTATRWYRVVRNCNGVGCNDPISNAVQVTVVPDPTISASGATTICSGGNASLSSSTSGGTGTCTYQWQISSTGSTSGFSNISGATGSTYNTGALTGTRWYRVVRNCNGSGCADPTSNAVQVTVVPDPTAPAITRIPNSSPICPGVTLTISSSGGSGGAGTCSDQYRYSTNNGGTWSGWSTSLPVFTSVTGTNLVQSRRVCTGVGCNTSSSNQVSWLVQDTENPTIVCPSNITVDSDAGNCSAVVTYTTPVGADNCPGQTTAQTAGLASGSAFPVGTTTNTFVVTDASGNMASCSFTVTVNDAESPTIVCPSNITVDSDAGNCSAVVTYTTPVGADNCPGQTTAQTAGLASGSAFPVGTTTNTFVVTDASGNMASCSFTVTVNDAESPTIVCPSNITVDSDAGNCSAVVTYATPVGADNCPGQTTAQTAGMASGSAFPVGTTTNTFVVTDASGNMTSCSFTVTVNDAESPTIVCPSNITVDSDAGNCSAVVTYTTPVGADNCPGQTTAQTAGLASGSAFPVGTTTNTFVVTDASGNMASCSFTVTVNDAESPTIVCPSNITVDSDAGNCSAVVTYTPPVGADNCPGQTTAQTAGLASGSAFPVGTTTNTFVVTDASGNMASCSFTVTVNDAESPTIVCPSDITVDSDAGNCSAVVTYAPPVGADNCPGQTTAQTAGMASGSAFPVGTTTNTFVVTDASGNMTSCSFTVTVNDAESPTIVCPSNITVDSDAGNCSAVVTYTPPVGADNCPGQTTAQTAGLASGSAFPVGTTTNTFVVTDASGNMTSCSFTVTVNDAESPTIVCPSNITVDSDAGNCSAVVTYTTPVGADNCPGQTTAQTAGLASGSAFPVGTTTNTFVVTDASGNMASCSFTVTVNDAESPTIVCPSDITVDSDAGNCSAVVTYTPPVGADNCPGQTTAQTAGLASGSAFPVGTTTNTFVVTDASGNMASCSFTVTVNDAESPTIVCPSNITVDSDAGNCSAVVTYTTPVGADNCPGQTTAQTAGMASGSAFPVGTTTNTFVVTDASGNMTSCSFTVTVNDAESPTIVCPSNITVDSDAGNCSAVVTYAPPVGADNCPGQTTAQTAGLASGSAFPVGTTTNTFVVTDASGNMASCSFTVTVNDAESPTIVCPSDITVDSDAGNCSAVVTYATPVGADNCPGQTTAQTAGMASGSAFPVGTTTNTFVVTDASGNMTSCSFTVTVNDAESPTIVCPSNITVDSDAGNCSAVVTYTTPVGADNCPGQTTAQTAGMASGSAFPVGTTTNTFVVTDASGNMTSCSFTVTVNDAESPTIVCPSDITVDSDAGNCSAVVTYTTPVGADNCPGQTTAQTAGLASGSAFPVGTTTNTFVVTDASGNMASCSFTVTVNDAESPTIVCPSDITVDSDAGNCSAVVTYTTPVGADNCPGQTTAQTAGLASGSAFPLGTTTNTFVVTDASGNMASCSFTVTVNDAESPTIVCPSDDYG